jgi:hypothetical protein
VTTGLALLTLAATAAWIGILVAVHTRPTGYDPIRNAVSDYGVGRYRGYYRAQTAAAALAAVALAGALASGVDPRPTLPIALLLAFAAARLAIPSFPTDLDRARPTRTGRVHILLAGLAFGSIAWASATLPDRVPWSGIHGLLVTLGWIVVATAIACGLAMSSALHTLTAPFFGLVERVFYVAMIAWFLIVAAKLV